MNQKSSNSQIVLAAICSLILVSGIYFYNHTIAEAHEIENELSPLVPYDNFLISRTYPNQSFDEQAFRYSILQIANQNHSKSFHQINWTLQGPNNIGGRYNCVVPDPIDTNIIYAGAAQGGIFKTVNGGNSWFPIFDSHSYLSIGHIKIDPFNRNKIWVGTGDVNISGNVFLGDGVYLSNDGGNTWNNKGLGQTKVISQIEVDATDSNTIFVSTMGNPFAKDNNRGLYKSINGGSTWSQSLYINDSTGIISFVIDPNNHSIIYAAAFNRMRSESRSLVYGNESRIWQSTNGGSTWAVMTNGLPTGKLSRINLAAHANGGNTVVYACVVDTTFNVQGIYKTINNGTLWTSSTITNLNPTALNGQGWYYGNINVDPLNANHIFISGLELMQSYDAGNTWQQATPSWWLYEVHGDKHWMSFDKFNNYIIATDGGIYKSDTSCVNWRDIENIPASQFYHVAIDPNDRSTTPQYYGGLQDNGTVGGNAASINFWTRLYGGDGFQPTFIKNNPNLIYAETQYGNLNYSTSAGSAFFLMNNGINLDDSVTPWDMRYIVSPHNVDNLFCATDRLYKMTNAPNGFWMAISGKLSKPYFSGKKNNYATALAESPTDSGTLLIGTGDGNLWRSVNENNFSLINNSLPNRYFTSVNFSYQSHKRYFVTQQGYRQNDFTPHIYKTDDSASTWISIQGDLPNIGINDLYVIKQNDSFLLAATDGGLFATSNGGNHWQNISGNIPICPVLDVELDTFRHTIIAGTYARSMWTLSLDSVFDNIRNLLVIDTVTHVDTTHHPNGINNLEMINGIEIYPTITKQNFTVFTNQNVLSLTIFNQNGELIKSRNKDNFQVTESIENQPAGIYFVTITTVNNKRKTFKIIKQ